MQIARVGPWEFEMPEGWQHKVNDSSNSYFENAEGTKGLYVKSIEVREPKTTSSHLAEYIQDVHLRGFTEGATNSWEVVDRRSSAEGNLARSALDLFDESANYRVLSLVLASADEAVQISVHDYWCEDHAMKRDEFAGLESSIVKVASAA